MTTADALVNNFGAIIEGRPTYTPKSLPAPQSAPQVPLRSGTSGPVTSGVAAAGSVEGLALGGARLITSTDGLITISFPQTVTVTVDGQIRRLPVIEG